jgi:hypothetical protein
MKFEGGNFGILKLSKKVLIKKFKIEEFDQFSDFDFRKRIAFLMGYRSPKHGLVLFVKMRDFEKKSEILRCYQIQNLSKMCERDFEDDSGVSIKYMDYSPFQMIEFCEDRILVNIYDQLLIYEISVDFELNLLKNVEHFGSGFCGSAFFYDKNVILLTFSKFLGKYYIDENKMERKEIVKSLGKFDGSFFFVWDF